MGAEYIIMEKSQGIEIGGVWDAMKGSEKCKVLEQVVAFEKSFATAKFPLYGSLYYKQDIARHCPNLSIVCHTSDVFPPRFAIGPSTARSFFDEGRCSVETDRGPCEMNP